MLLSQKTFFFGNCDNLVITNQRAGTIVIRAPKVPMQSEDIHYFTVASLNKIMFLLWQDSSHAPSGISSRFLLHGDLALSRRACNVFN